MELREVRRVPFRELADPGLTIVLETASGQRFEAEIVDLSIKGTGLRFQGSELPSLELRDEVTIEIRPSASPSPSRLVAIVRAGQRVEGWCRYGLEFAGAPFAARGLASNIYRWLAGDAKQGAPRARPDRASRLPFEACLERRRAGALKGRVTQLHSGGASFEVGGHEELPGLGENTTLRFSLRPRTEALEIDAKVRGCEPLEASEAPVSRLTRCFEAPSDPAVQDQIDRYVLERVLAKR